MTARKIAFAVLAMALFAQPALAQTPLVFCGNDGEPDCTLQDLFFMVYRVVNFLISMAGLVAILFIVIGGLKMAFAAGNPKSIDEGKETLKNAVTGLVLVLLSYLVVSYVAGFLIPGAGGADPLRGLINFLRPTP